LAKNPQVIIADEPTGNLDSKNTQEIMNIIRAIAQTKLVVLVTHEEGLADYYGDRIIRLQDGRIVSDQLNESNGALDLRHETDIYLHDLTAIQKTEHLEHYTDEPLDDQVKVRLIVKNKTLYVDVQSKEYKKIQLIEPDSEVRIHDRAYQPQTKDDVAIEPFALESVIDPSVSTNDKHSVISVKDSLRIAWARMTNSSRMGKVFYVVFALIAGLFALAVSIGNSYVTFEEEDYLNDSRYLVNVDKGLNDYDDFLALEGTGGIDRLRPYDDIQLTMKLPTVFQSYTNTTNVVELVEPIDRLDESDIIQGRMAENPLEFLIDKRIADQLIQQNNLRSVGVTTHDDLFEMPYFGRIDGIDGDYLFELTLVGIVEGNTPMMYLDEDLILMLSFNVGFYEYFADDLTLAKGALPDESFEALIYDNEFLPDPFTSLPHAQFGEDYTFTGSFTMNGDNGPMVLVQKDDILRSHFNATYTSPSSTVPMLADDVEDALNTLSDEQMEASSYAMTQREAYRSERLRQGVGTITFIVVMIAASSVSYFFVIRSSLLARIYEVSVYRALGVNRLDVHKMFAVETLMVTTITSVLGYGAATFLMWRLQLATDDVLDLLRVTPLSILVGLLMVYAVNLLSGAIPVANLLRRTPAEILNKYDF
jgi:ABC-type antimicrobial peptide transport system permease subunit